MYKFTDWWYVIKGWATIGLMFAPTIFIVQIIKGI